MPIEIKIREDIAKLHSEANQLRSQQFVLATVALTVVGFSSLMIPALNKGENILFLQATATVFLQLLLTILFIWSIALRRLIGTISAYLKIKEASDWERDFYQFSRNKRCGHWSQTGWVRSVYVVLGLLLAVNYVMWSVGKEPKHWEWPAWLVYVSSAVYL